MKFDTNDGLSQGDYRAEVDAFDADEWASIISGFDDATVYQCAQHAEVRAGLTNSSRLALRHGNRIVGAAQIKIKMIPALRAGVADVYCGPLWRIGGERPDPEIFRQMIRALRQEYVATRNLFLRIRSNEFGQVVPVLDALLKEEGFSQTSVFRNPGTFLIDLSPSLEELRMGFSKGSRKNLRRAERRGMTVSTGCDRDAFDKFALLYEEMFVRKVTVAREDIESFWRIHERLPDDLKLRFEICEADGEPVSASVWSKVGERAIGLFRANGFRAMELGSSYLLSWHLIQAMKAAGARYYDLGNSRSPGNAGFKARTGAKAVSYLPPHYAGNSLAGKLCGLWGERISHRKTRLKIALGRLKRRVTSS